ncbi:class IV lanthionine synthetase LanL [Streptomyces sp. NPDC006476]|uniref:class IV lanthionine synthetase LanL n=1 Tax=Streptomyces sp. NPDC006476 TaxID=3157175 RepID=UPI0033A3E351
MSLPLDTLVRSVLSEQGADGWEIVEEEFWCRVHPTGHPSRVQGWKLHLSATALSAPEVLYRSARVLVHHGCAFKFAARSQDVETLTSSRYDRAQCGKFITAYPQDDDRFRELARALDAATAGLPGPAILSDRPYRTGSLVHYRFGAFQGVKHRTQDGVEETRLLAPDGSAVRDVRNPWFSPPPWAELPLPGPAAPAPPAAGAPQEMVLHGRYAVHAAIRHRARGGVYRAVDQDSGRAVVIKQARAHVGSGFTGHDCRDVLRREAASLTALKGVVPELLDLFEEGGHLFLVVAEVPGLPLGRWAQERFSSLRDHDGGLPVGEVVVLAADLAELVAEVHRRGLVYCDLSPSNIMIGPDGRLLLVDAECALRADEWGHCVYTPGFAAPEYALGPVYGPAPDPAADLFSLGALLFYLATGADPAFAAAEADGGPPVEQLDAVLAAQEPRNAAARLLAPAVRGLCAQDPAQRWSVEQLRTLLAGPVPPQVTTSGLGPAQLAAPLQDTLIGDGIAHIVGTMERGGTDRLWPRGRQPGEGAGGYGVQHGAAGVLSVLIRAADVLGRKDLEPVVRHVAAWTDARLDAVSGLPPGLYSGRAGVAWALHEAARHLDDAELLDRAERFALALPVRWPNPDVFHGVAGVGLTQLKLWQSTGRQRFLDRAAQCADALLAVAEHDRDGIFWQVPRDFDSGLAGAAYLGYAHGVAGIGSFLLVAATATGRDAYLEASHAAARTLFAEAERGPWGARWRTDRAHEPGSGLLHHLCSGASGVGTFLIRLWRATGDARALELAEAAARAAYRVRWTSGTSVCHGLAGDGEFLLDMAQAVGGPYQGWAEELAACLYIKRRARAGLVVVPDESGTQVAVDYGVGLAGVVGFLLRVRYGGPRLLTADDASPTLAAQPLTGR